MAKLLNAPGPPPFEGEERERAKKNKLTKPVDRQIRGAKREGEADRKGQRREGKKMSEMV